MNLDIASCLAHRKRVHWDTGEAWWMHPDGNPCDPLDPAIGNRVCSRCGSKLFAHCYAHFFPCCPGQCPGTARRGGRRGGGRPARPRRAS